MPTNGEWADCSSWAEHRDISALPLWLPWQPAVGSRHRESRHTAIVRGSDRNARSRGCFLPLPETDSSHGVQRALDLITPVAEKCPRNRRRSGAVARRNGRIAARRALRRRPARQHTLSLGFGSISRNSESESIGCRCWQIAARGRRCRRDPLAVRTRILVDKVAAILPGAYSARGGVLSPHRILT